VAEIARWIEREVARGLQGLVALRLPGAPGEDAVTLTLDIWLAALAVRTASWTEAQDAPRLQAAFRTLYAQCTTWPAPRQLLDALPIRAPPTALPPPPMTAEDRAANRARLAALMQQLSTRMTGHDHDHPEHPQRHPRNLGA
jgi:hypothetical protein